MRKDYIPQWYIEKVEKKEIKYYQSFTLILIIMVLILSGCALKNISSYNTLVLEGSKKVNNMDQEPVKKYSDMKTFKYVQENILKSTIKPVTINIEKNVISMIINVDDINEYLTSVKQLEDSSEIVSLSNIIQKEAQKYFEVKVKIKDENY